MHYGVLLGISLFIPLFLSCSFHDDLSETVLPTSNMSYEDSGVEDLLTFQDELKAFMPTVSSGSFYFWAHLRWGSRLYSIPLTSVAQSMPVLRC